jgi:hypothetical protein
MKRPPLTIAEVGALPAVTDLETAARALGIGRTTAYRLARDGQFPVPVIRAGSSWRVPVPGLRAALGLPPAGPGGGVGPPAPGRPQQP